jgi:uncharacterized phage protein (TIGR01671 family)
MREIKFRGWDKRTRKMIDTGFHILGETTCFDLIYDYCMNHGKRKDEVGLLRINSVVIMQYTGRKDQDGKDIYDGDIIKCNGGAEDFFFEVAWDNEQAGWIAKVDWCDGKEKSYPELKWYIGWKFIPVYEVIGNIYENPELIKAHK